MALAAAVAAAAQWRIAVRFYGFLTGDEVEVLGEAFRVATGYRYTLWDVRNAFVPDVIVAAFIRAAVLVGVRDPGSLIVAATIPFIAASSATVILVHRLALRWTGDALAAAAATALFALHWMPLGYGGTTYPRVIAMACIAGAALLVSRDETWSAAAAGALAGVAFADRYSEIVFLLPLLVVARRRWWQVAAGFAASIAVTVGITDWIRWGSPFWSLREFAHVTLVERDFASRVKHQPPWWYLAALPRWCAPTLLVLLWRARVGAAWWLTLVPLAALSLVAHKELRYLQGIIPFLCILGGAGFAGWWRERRALAAALLAISLAWGAYGLRFLARESMPAVDAARFLARDPSARSIAMGQVWAYGDLLYLRRDQRVTDVGTPPEGLAAALPQSDRASLYESDLTPEIETLLAREGFVREAAFRAPRARDVIVFRRAPAYRT